VSSPVLPADRPLIIHGPLSPVNKISAAVCRLRKGSGKGRTEGKDRREGRGPKKCALVQRAGCASAAARCDALAPQLAAWRAGGGEGHVGGGGVEGAAAAQLARSLFSSSPADCSLACTDPTSQSTCGGKGQWGRVSGAGSGYFPPRRKCTSARASPKAPRLEEFWKRQLAYWLCGWLPFVVCTCENGMYLQRGSARGGGGGAPAAAVRTPHRKKARRQPLALASAGGSSPHRKLTGRRGQPGCAR
jgi:hypothetical protein